MWQLLKKLVFRQQSISAGEETGRADSTGSATHQCYTACDPVSRWQGDLYKTEHFTQNALPATGANVPLWMLANRTCQLEESEGRSVHLAHLVYFAVVPLKVWMKGQERNVRNAISNLVKGHSEHACFLPASSAHGISEPLVAEFNLIYSVKLGATPKATQKIAQLSSPFSEHVFQHFSRWFYTVGYDDTQFRTPTYLNGLVRHVEGGANQASEASS